MTAANYAASLAFVWLPGYDSPLDGYHVTVGDPGGGTKGGVIEATWKAAVSRLLVRGKLAAATNQQLSIVLRDGFWGNACDALPDGIDFMLFNGRMMSGEYPLIFQRCLGFTGDDVDGDIGPMTIAAARDRNPRTLIYALYGQHYAYLAGLEGWDEFKGGWTRRLVAAHMVGQTLSHTGGATLS